MEPLTCPHCGADVTATVTESLCLHNALIESACLACDQIFWIALAVLTAGGLSATVVVSLLATLDEVDL
jgi:hypothetical protein